MSDARTTIVIPDSAGGAEHCVEVWDAGASQFAARLRKVARERRRWAARAGIACYRVYDADLPDYALAIDIYHPLEETAGQVVAADGRERPDDVAASSGTAGDAGAEDLPDGLGDVPQAKACGTPVVHVAEYQAPAGVDEARAQRRLADALAIIPVVFGIDDARVFVKTRRRERGGSQYALRQEAPRESFAFETTEPAFDGAQLIFNVDMTSYLDTGLFLDHRTTRQLVGREVARRVSAGQPPRFLNLFAYTGSATVHAAAAGARATTTVDLSQTYLDWAARNMAANGFAGVFRRAGEGAGLVAHGFERADVLQWLDQAAALGRRFDVVFVDPPTFSNSKAMGTQTWDVQRDHVRLLRGVRAVMAPGAFALFSCNLRTFRPDGAALEAVGIRLVDITAQTIPDDWARNPKIHRCYTFTTPIEGD